MLTKQAASKAFSNTLLVALAMAFVLVACAPAQSPDQVQSLVGTSVVMTVQAQNQVATGVAQTTVAQLPAATASPTPTTIVLDLPTPLPTLATVTPFVAVPPSKPRTGQVYSCSWTELKPRQNVFAPGDAIDVLWVITNTGTQTWYTSKDLNFVSGTKFLPYSGQELPPLKPGGSVKISFEGHVPMEKGLYGMQFKVEGGLCWPALNIQVGK